VLGRDLTQSTILPLLLRLLKDDESEVRFHLISKVDVLCRVLGADVLAQSLAPAILELSHDAKWRVRLSVVEKLAYLGKQLVQTKLGGFCCLRFVVFCVLCVLCVCSSHVCDIVLASMLNFSLTLMTIANRVLFIPMHRLPTSHCHSS
jgi:hypothetical protein